MSSVMKAAPANAVAVDYDPFADGGLSRVVPTTEPQRELWLAARLGEDASLAYNESVSLRLRGALDADRLQRALQSVLERHDALRAGFGPDGETFCVLEPAPLRLPLTDLSVLPAAEREAQLAERRRLGVETPFDLEQGRLLRTELLRIAPQEYVLLMHAHHIVCDGWSWWVIVRELAATYAQGSAASLPQPQEFAEFALSEAKHPAGPQFREDEQYWLSRFAGGAPVLELPTDRPRPARRTFASLREDHVLDADLVAAIRRLGARRGASLFATLLGSFAALMSRIAGQDEVVVGIPAAGQSVDGNDHLVGHCVNLLPLRFDLQPTDTVNQLLDGAQSILLDAIEHQRYTFGTLLKRLRVERDPSRLPLVSVMFNIDQALDQEKNGFPGIDLDFTTNPRHYENFELSINAVQVDGTLRLETQYNTGLFDAQTVRRWLSAFETMLRAACEAPDERISRLALVSPALFAELGALQPAPVAFDRQCGMHEFFEWQCDRAPERTAVRADDGVLDYARLEARANRIARLLRGHGVRNGALVGLSMDRGTDMLAALLGILKAGAGYVPLDPQFPADRLSYMAGDAGLAVLLTQRRHASRFDLRGRPVLALDGLEDELAALPDTRLGRDAGAAEPESPAYVIYTSGSTGRPKGVQVPHRAVSNFITAMQAEPGLGRDDRLVAVTTLSFDIAVLELLLPLSVGAEVILAGKDTVIDGVALAALLRDSGATAMQATPASWRLLLEAGWPGSPGFKAMCGGEPLPPDLAQALLPLCGQLWNLYGPTETTVWSTAMRVEAAPDGRAPDIHVGRPIANTQVWILDDSGQPCPRGVPGEICIGGEGVTLGYLARPELTAERFLPDAFADPGKGFGTGIEQPLLYRTGDRGRWRADGNLEHLGRLDFQVKVRGFRIELGEIESQLLAHPGVSRAVAMAREDRPGDVRLVAYLVLAPGLSLDDEALVAHLKQHLPDYMVPQHFMRLAEIPLLPNGKVNRKGLPAPEVTVQAAGEIVAPRNELEARIATIMAGVLGLPAVGVHDNFFASGGHSLLAAQLTSRINRELGLGLSLRTLFDAPTVEKLAAAIGNAPQDALPPRPPIVHREDQREAPLSLTQERLKLLEEFNPGQLTYNTPSAHWLIGPLDPVLFERAFQAVMQRQSVLRTTIEERDGESVQVVHDRLESGLAEIEDLTHLPVDERERALMQRLNAIVGAPFELVGAPLFRAKLFKFDHDRHALMFMTHHIIWDGWSFDLLYRDLAETYAAYVEGREPSLPPLPVTYGDFSVWHREWVETEQYARQREFWRRKLGEAYDEGESGVLDLSRGRAKRGTASGRGLSQGFHIDKALGDRLRQVGLGMDATLFVVLLTAYFVLLNRVSGRRDMVIATPVRGRNSAEVEELMGYFTNLLPLRVKLDPELPFSDAVRRVKDVVLDSFANPDIRLEEVAQELSSRGGQRVSALYQTLFSMQDIRQRVTRWGNLAHERLEVFQPGATEDLGLWLLERDDGIIASMVYNADVLLAGDVEALRGHYVALLERIAGEPQLRIGALGEFPLPPVAPEAPEPPEPPSAPVADSPGRSPAPAAPVASPKRDPRVSYLAELWSSLLETPVSPDDNFFDLGGHSMVAVQMASKVAKDTGAKLKMMPLATQTLAQLAMELPLSAFPAEPEEVADPAILPQADGEAAQDTGRAFYFGPPRRRLFGMLHAAASPRQGAADAVLVASPLLQEGITSQRALWSLCEAMADRGTPALRFDWFGAGDSMGEGRDLSLSGMQEDLQGAIGHLSDRAPGVRLLTLRSGSLPVLLRATAGSVPVDLVLWDPVMRGAPMVERWRRQHREQLVDAGRYIVRKPVPTADDEVLGFDVAPALLDDLSQLDFRKRPLPAGSRVLVAAWHVDQDLQDFIDTQASGGVAVQTVLLTASDQPPWDDPAQFENQAMPRRSVTQLAQALTEGGA